MSCNQDQLSLNQGKSRETSPVLSFSSCSRLAFIGKQLTLQLWLPSPGPHNEKKAQNLGWKCQKLLQPEQQGRSRRKEGSRDLRMFGMGAGLHLLGCFLSSPLKSRCTDTQVHTQTQHTKSRFSGLLKGSAQKSQTRTVPCVLQSGGAVPQHDKYRGGEGGNMG